MSRTEKTDVIVESFDDLQKTISDLIGKISTIITFMTFEKNPMGGVLIIEDDGKEIQLPIYQDGRYIHFFSKLPVKSKIKFEKGGFFTIFPPKDYEDGDKFREYLKKVWKESADFI